MTDILTRPGTADPPTPAVTDQPTPPPHQDGPPVPQDALLRHSIGPFRFESGGELPDVEIAYETWGTLNADRSNAVLVLHALTGSTHVAATAADPEPGWWEGLVLSLIHI